MKAINYTRFLPWLCSRIVHFVTILQQLWVYFMLILCTRKAQKRLKKGSKRAQNGLKKGSKKAQKGILCTFLGIFWNAIYILSLEFCRFAWRICLLSGENWWECSFKSSNLSRAQHQKQNQNFIFQKQCKKVISLCFRLNMQMSYACASISQILWKMLQWIRNHELKR